jgi:RNA polymerase sigma-70 factor (ECF subfamily)
MLQAVLGLDAGRIASAFLVSPAAMAQRLVRAKARIREAGLRFEVPGEEELPRRLDAVLEAIYAAYGSAWDDVTGGDLRTRDLATEAIGLARLIVHLLPTAAEARGLLALMLHCEARRGARRSASGAFVPLSEQDTTRWSRPLIEEAERQLAAAGAARQLGHFQLEAAIQSAHASRAAGSGASREDIALLYEGLVRLAPTVGALVSRAAAAGDAFGAERGLALLAEVPPAKTLTYQPYWALRAHLLSALGRVEESGAAYERAIGLTEDPAVRSFLVERRVALMTWRSPVASRNHQ